MRYLLATSIDNTSQHQYRQESAGTTYCCPPKVYSITAVRITNQTYRDLYSKEQAEHNCWNSTHSFTTRKTQKRSRLRLRTVESPGKRSLPEQVQPLRLHRQQPLRPPYRCCTALP
jgi:hypothetical protein